MIETATLEDGKPQFLAIASSPPDAALYRTTLPGHTDHRQITEPREIEAALHERHWDVIICDFSISAPTEILALVKQAAPATPLIFVGYSATVPDAGAMMRLGARGFVDRAYPQHLAALVEEELHGPPSPHPVESLCASIVEHQTDLICRFDLGLNITFVNPAYCKWVEQPASVLIGTSILDPLPLDEREPVVTAIAALSAQHPTTKIVQQVTRHDGPLRLMEWTNVALTDPQGRVVAYQGMGRDVTERENRYRQLETLKNELTEILDTTQDAVISLSLPDRRLIYVSASFNDVFGSSVDAFIADPDYFRHVIHPDDLPAALQAMQQGYQDGYTELDHRIILPDGQVRWIHRRAWVNFDEQGHPIRVNDSGLDITARKQAENELRFHSEILRNLSEGVQIVRASDLTFVYMNPAFEQMFGYEPGELIGQHVSILNAPTSATPLAVADGITGQLEKAGHFSGEVRSIRKDGSLFWTAGSVAAFDHAEYGPVWISVQHDITARKQAENELRFHSEILRNMAEGVHIVRASDATLVYANPTMERMFGYEPGELLGQNVSLLLDPAAQAPHQVVEAIRHILHETDTWHGELPRIRKDGTLFWSSNSLIAFEHAEFGEVWITVQQDITAQKLAQDALNHQATLLEQISDVVIQMDKQFRITAWNRAATQTYGWTEAEAIGQPVHILLQAQFISASRDEVEVALATTGMWRGHVVEKTRSGSSVHVLISISRLFRQGEFVGYIAVNRDITATHRRETFQRNISSVLEAVANAEPLPDLLTQLVRAVEDYQPIIRASVLLVDTATQTLLHGAAPSLPDAYCAAIHGLHYAPGEGSCGTAAAEKRLVIVSDIQTDPLWRNYRNLAAQYNLRACWSQPILGENDTILGTFALYYDHVRAPSPDELDLIGLAGRVAGIAIRRTHSEAALRASEERYRHIVQDQSEYVCRYTADLRVTFGNRAYCAMFGVPQDAIVGQPILTRIPPEDHAQVLAHVQSLTLENPVAVSVHHGLTSDGKLSCTEWKDHAIFNDLGQIIEYQGVGRDITEQRRAEEALRESQERYRSIIEDQTEFVVRYDANICVTFANSAYCRAYGYTPATVVGAKILATIPPEAHDRMWAYLNSMTPDHPTGFSAHPSTQADGKVHWVEWKDRAILNDAGQIIEYQGVGRDVTDQRAAQDALRESEARLRTLLNSQTNFVMRSDLLGRITYFNDKFEREWGWLHPDGILGTSGLLSICDYHHDRTRETVEKCLMQPGTVFTVDLDKPSRDGTIRTTLWEFVCITDERGAPTEMQCVGIEITDRKRAEEALRASEEKLRALISSQTNFVVRTDLDGRMTYWNNKFEQEFGWIYEPEGLQGGWSLKSICTHHHPRVMETVQQCLAQPNTVISVEIDKPARDGSVRSTLWEFVCLTDAEGQPVEMQCMGIEITDRKRAEEALRASEEKYRSLVESSDSLILMLALDGTILYSNAIAAAHYHATPETMAGRNFRDIYPPDVLADRKAKLDEMVRTGQGLHFEATSTTHPDQDVWFNVTLQPIRDSDGQIVAAFINSQDITDRKHAEQALRASEERYRSLIESADSAIAMFAPDGTLLYINSRAAAALGQSPATLLGMKMQTLFPPEVAAPQLDSVREVVGSGEGRTAEAPTILQGQEHWFRTSVQPVRDANGNFYAALINTFDITDRKQAEDALAAAHALLEQRVVQRTEELERAKDRIEAIFNHSGDGILLLDVEYGVQQTNYAFDQMFNLPPDSAVGLGLPLFFDLADADHIAQMVHEVAQSHQTLQIEARALRLGGTTFDAEISLAPINRSDKAVTNLVCIVRDVSERKQAQIALEKYAAEVYDLYNFAPAGYHSLDNNGTITRINTTELLWLGYVENEVVGKLKLTDLLTPASQVVFRQYFPIFIEQGHISDLEFEFVRKDGSTFWALVNATAIYDQDGHFMHSRSSLLDVTELKQVQQAVAEERNLLRTVIDTVPDFIYVKDLQHRVVLNNVAHAKTLSVASPAATVGKTDLEMFPRELAEKFHADEDRIYASGQGLYNVEERSRGTDGQAIWALTTKIPLHNLNGEVIGLVGTTHDITHLKESEAALRRTQADLLSVIDSTTTMFVLVDRDGVVRLVNRLARAASMSLNGKPIGVGDMAADCMPPEYGDNFRARFAEVLRGNPVTAVFHVIRNNQPSYLEFRFYPVRAKDGEVVGMNIAADDITERKEIEQKLRYLASLQEQMYEAVIGTSLDYHVQSWNKAAERMYGWTAEEVMGKDASEMLRSEALSGESVAETRASLREVGYWQGEVIHHHRDGTPVWVSLSVNSILDADGKPAGYIVVGHDITARKRAEQELAQKRQQELAMQGYLTALHEIAIGLTRTNTLDEFYRLTVQEGLEHFGFERMGLLLLDPTDGAAIGTYGTDPTGMIVPEHHLRLEPGHLTGILQRTIDRHERVAYDEHAHLFFNLEVVSEGQNAVAALWNGSVLGWLAVDNAVYHQPITQPQLDILALYALSVGALLARKRAEFALRQSEERYRFLAENIPDVIVKLSLDGVYTYVSPSSYHLTGHSPEEILGTPVERYVHPDDWAAGQLAGLEVMKSGGSVFTIAQRLQHKDGHYLWTETTSTVIRDVETGAPSELISLVHDITERKAAEDALRESEARYRLLAENVHDVILRFTPDLVRTYTTPSSMQLLGYTPEETDGQPLGTHTHPDDVALLKDSLNEAIRAGATTFSVVIRLIHKAGHPVWVEINATIVREGSTGQILEFIAIVHDITERKAAEDALRDSEARYRLLAENIKDCILKISPAGVHTYVSPSSQSITGHLPEELIGQATLQFVHPDDLVAISTIAERVIHSHESFFTLVHRLRHKEGHYVWVEVTTTIIRNPQTAEIIEFVSLVHDITERKAAEDALRDSEARYRFLAENINDVIIKSSADGLPTYVSSASHALTGFAPEELIGISTADLTHPDDRADLADYTGQVIRMGGNFFSFVHRLRRKAGDYVWVESTTTIMRDAETGLPSEYISLVHDITERKAAVDALRQSETNFRKYVDSAPLATVISDQHGKIVVINAAAERLFGYQRHELVGQSIDVLVPEELREYHADHRTLYESMPESRRLHPLQLQARRHDGTVFPADIQLSDIDTQPTPMVMSLIIDVTERKTAELALQQALEQEKEVVELKSRFVSMASHEFRTPLAAIMATTETLTFYRDRMDASQIDLRLDKIRQQVNHMKDIMEEVLELARIQAGKIEFKPSISDLDAVCQEVIEEFDSQALYRGRLVYVSHPMPLYAVFDRRLLRQIMGNLISNALKYSPMDKLVHIALHEEATQLVFTVTDEGIGIPPADIKRLFEPFHRASNVGTISGTGLGLSITKQGVDLHHGTIYPESVVGVGTTFVVTIPKLRIETNDQNIDN